MAYPLRVLSMLCHQVHAAAFPIAELQDAHYTQPWFTANQFVFGHTRGAPDGSGMVVSLAIEITFDNSGECV